MDGGTGTKKAGEEKMGEWAADASVGGKQVDLGQARGSQIDPGHFLLPPSWGSVPNLQGPRFLRSLGINDCKPLLFQVSLGGAEWAEKGLGKRRPCRDNIKSVQPPPFLPSKETEAQRG